MVEIDPTPTQPLPLEGVPDTGDLVDPTAEDPTADEVTDPTDPSYVRPDPQASPVGDRG
jgi:hypothetical protein